MIFRGKLLVSGILYCNHAIFTWINYQLAQGFLCLSTDQKSWQPGILQGGLMEGSPPTSTNIYQLYQQVVYQYILYINHWYRRQMRKSLLQALRFPENKDVFLGMGSLTNLTLLNPTFFGVMWCKTIYSLGRNASVVPFSHQSPCPICASRKCL